MSAEVFRATIPSRVDFPTPEPANIPIRCPRPRGITASMARIPVSIRLEIGSLSMGEGGAAYMG